MLILVDRKAGASAGTAVDLLFFPLDTLKTRLQSSQGFVRAGGFRGVYRGVGSVLVGSAPGGESCDIVLCDLHSAHFGFLVFPLSTPASSFVALTSWVCFCFRSPAAAFFTTYDSLKRVVPNQNTPINHVISASVGEVVACLVRVPVEVVKSRTQTGSYGLQSSSFDAFRRVWTQEGPKGLYRGFGMTVFREVSHLYRYVSCCRRWHLAVMTRFALQFNFLAHERTAFLIQIYS